MTAATEATDSLAAAARPGHRGGRRPPVLSGGWPLVGHLLELRKRPIELFQRVRDELGEIGEINLAGNRVVMMMGESAQEAFFRAPDEQLDQAAAYPFMKPVFGEGVVFDGTPEQRKQAMRNQSLRAEFMKGHAATISHEVERMMEKLGDEGEIDLLDFFSELTVYTSTACLIGKEFREEMTPAYFRTFYDLEKGTDAWAYVNPHLPLPVFRTRDRARRELVAMLTEVFERRQRNPSTKKELFDHLLAARDARGNPVYTIDRITGLFISLMFAGHHTTSGTAAWTLIELLKNPAELEGVTDELDEIYADGREVSYQALREIPRLERALYETLRLHPPLIILMRKVMSDFQYGDWTIPAGRLVGVSPAVSNRMPECFPEPDRFDPSRYGPGREEDKQLFAWIPFGAGRHRCVGAAFALMQLKAIFSDLLRRYEFELVQPSESYRNDHSKMVVQLEQPCRARYRLRRRVDTTVGARGHGVADDPMAAGQAASSSPLSSAAPFEESPAVPTAAAASSAEEGLRIRVDLDLCQGHRVCVTEAPEVFEIEHVDGADRVRLKCERASPELREKIELAVHHCPTRALSIETDDATR